MLLTIGVKIGIVNCKAGNLSDKILYMCNYGRCELLQMNRSVSEPIQLVGGKWNNSHAETSECLKMQVTDQNIAILIKCR